MTTEWGDEHRERLVAAIAAFPGLPLRLMAEHVRGPDGRCRLCPIGGQAGYQHWPCRIYGYASRAQAVIERVGNQPL